jgi:hypothetical protein
VFALISNSVSVLEPHMTLLFAHHLEIQHVSITLILLFAGGWIGWAITSFLIDRNNAKVRPSA